MINASHIRYFLGCSLLAACLSVPAIAGAASQCKGMAQSQCGSNDDCSWIDGYTRKDGREVRGHCKLSSRKPKLSLASPSAGEPSGR
jgi:hypothetical protein